MTTALRHALINQPLNSDGLKTFRAYIAESFPQLDKMAMDELPVEGTIAAIMKTAKLLPDQLAEKTIPDATPDIKKYLTNDINKLLTGELGIGGTHRKSYSRGFHSRTMAGTSNYMVVTEHVLEAMDKLREIVGKKNIPLSNPHAFVSMDQGRSILIEKLRDRFPDLPAEATFKEVLREAPGSSRDLAARLSTYKEAKTVLKHSRMDRDECGNAINRLAKGERASLSITRSFYELLAQAVIDAHDRKLTGVDDISIGDVTVSFRRPPFSDEWHSYVENLQHKMIASIRVGNEQKEIKFSLPKTRLLRVFSALSDAIAKTPEPTVDRVAQTIMHYAAQAPKGKGR